MNSEYLLGFYLYYECGVMMYDLLIWCIKVSWRALQR